VTKWRITHIVVWGLQLTFIGFGVVAVYSIVEDASTTARIASGTAAVIHVLRGLHSTRPGPAWPRENERKIALWFTAALTLVLAGNVVVGSVGYLHAIMLVLFTGPASVFATAVREIYDDRYRQTEKTEA
jgi:hypothetical protein